MLISLYGIKLLQDHIDVLIHFVQSSGMNALNLLYFLDVLVMVVRGSSKRSNSFIHCIHSSGTSLSHGSRNDALIPLVRIALVDLCVAGFEVS